MPLDQSLKVSPVFADPQRRDPPPAQGEVPERIRTHAPEPELKPEGSWRARADAMDRAVRERQEAEKASNEWAARVKVRHRPGMRMAFTRSARF